MYRQNDQTWPFRFSKENRQSIKNLVAVEVHHVYLTSCVEGPLYLPRLNRDPARHRRNTARRQEGHMSVKSASKMTLSNNCLLWWVGDQQCRSQLAQHFLATKEDCEHSDRAIPVASVKNKGDGKQRDCKRWSSKGWCSNGAKCAFMTCIVCCEGRGGRRGGRGGGVEWTGAGCGCGCGCGCVWAERSGEGRCRSKRRISTSAFTFVQFFKSRLRNL